jgi:NADH:ubiquinone oxidoreductase subunit 4 (subunit M)
MGAFMVLIAVFLVQPWAASLAATGMILAPIYALIIMQKGFSVQQKTGQYDP